MRSFHDWRLDRSKPAAAQGMMFSPERLTNGPAERAETSRRLVDVANRLSETVAAVETTLGDASPESPSTLAAVVTTLTAMIPATEAAAGRVLAELDGLERDRGNLGHALGRLDTASALAAGCAQAPITSALTPMGALVTVMDLQNVTAQHLRAAARAVQDARACLTRVLGMLALSLDGSEVAWNPRATATAWRLALGKQLLERLEGDRLG